MKNFLLSLFITLILTITSVTYIGEASAAGTALPHVQFMNDPSDYWITELANDAYSGTFSQKYSNNGLPAYRFELRDTDPNVKGSKRAEISEDLPELSAGYSIYRFSVLLPEGDGEDYALDPEGSEIIAQWHNVPDPGEEWTNPPLSIHTGAYYNEPDHYTLEVNWDEAPLSTNSTLKRERFDLGSFARDKGVWVDWEVRVKWGWLLSQSPSLQIIKNSSEIFSLANQPNTTNDQQGVKMKLGVYKWDWTQGIYSTSIIHKRVIYFNNISKLTEAKALLYKLTAQ